MSDAVSVSIPTGHTSNSGDWRQRCKRLLPVLIPWLVFIYAGINGVDFGQHWDEDDHLHNVRHSLETQTLLPTGGDSPIPDPQLKVGFYVYPSVLYWVVLGSAAPEIAANFDDVTRIKLLGFVTSQPFRLRVRAICVVISSLAIVWVYLAVLQWGGRWQEALLAASILAGSWEISYHSRWIATDTIVMQFAALCIWLCIGALDSPKGKNWTRYAAIAAGLAIGSKYTAGLLLIPVCLSVWFRGGRVWSICKHCLMAGAAFLITTPGALIQPWTFMHWMNYMHRLYGTIGHYGYTVAGSGDHLRKIATYESIVLLSHWPLVAGSLFLFAILGALLFCWRSRRLAALLLVFPIVYVLYFSSQRIMIARNLMVLSPFVAILCARGLGSAVQAIKGKNAQGLTIAMIEAIVVGNLIFTVYASRTIRDAAHGIAYDVDQLRQEMTDHPRTRYDLTPEAMQLLRLADPGLAARPAPQSPEREVVIACEGGGEHQAAWPANQWNLTMKQFGPYDVNFNYYPTWIGDRIVMLDMNVARSLPMRDVRQIIRRRDADTRRSQ